jgi:hypothetical protein
MADGADREPVMNLGHIAAWGALVATQLAHFGHRDRSNRSIVISEIGGS